MDVQHDSGKTRANRRKFRRHAVDAAASLLLVNHGSYLPCRILDLSLGGCRLYMDRRFLAGIFVRVELVFQLCGTQQRISGVTQWTNGNRLVGIRFLDVSDRKHAQLVELLGEVMERPSGSDAAGQDKPNPLPQMEANSSAAESAGHSQGVRTG